MSSLSLSLSLSHTHTHTQGEPEEALHARIREAEDYRTEGHIHREIGQLGQTPDPNQAPQPSAEKMAPEAKGEVSCERTSRTARPFPAPPAAAAPAERANSATNSANSNADATPPENAPVAADAPASEGGAG